MAIGRAWLSVAALIGLTVTLVGCQASPAGKGVVVGGIDACSVVPSTGSSHTGFIAGTVIVLGGTVSKRPAAGATTNLILPSDQVTSRTVGKNRKYRFVLPPGPYVLADRYPGQGTFVPWVSVVVHLDKVTRQDIPNDCPAPTHSPPSGG